MAIANPQAIAWPTPKPEIKNINGLLHYTPLTHPTTNLQKNAHACLACIIVPRTLRKVDFWRSTCCFAARMAFARILSVIVREKLPFQQLNLSLNRAVVACGFATRKQKPTKIKRPPTAFQMFASANRARLAAENPHKSPREIQSALSHEWKEMSEDGKSPYKKAYAEKMEIYNAPLKKLPKKPPTKYTLFLQENYARVQAQLSPGSGGPAVMSELAKEWNSLSNEEKDQLEQKCAKMKEDYKLQVIEFGKGLTDQELSFLKEKRGQKMQKLAKEMRQLLGYPKRPISSYFRFTQENLGELENEPLVERVKVLGQKWREMTDDEKEVYKEESRKEHEKYKKDVAEWKQKHPKALQMALSK